MMKSINVSTKITILIFTVSLAAVVAISFFSYDYHVKSNREKYATILTALAEERASLLENHLAKAAGAVQLLQHSDMLKAGGVAPAGGGGMDALMAGMPDMGPPPDAAAAPDSTLPSTGTAATTSDPLVDFLTDEKFALGVDEIYIASTAGVVVSSTDPEIKAGEKLSDTDGLTFDRAQKGIHYANILRRNKKAAKNEMTTTKRFVYETIVAGSYSTNTGVVQLIVVKINLTAPYAAMMNFKGLAETGELVVAQIDQDRGTTRIVSPRRADTTMAIPSYKIDEAQVVSFSEIAKGKSAIQTITVDGTTYLQAGHALPNGNLVLAARMSEEEASGDSGDLLNTFIYAGLCILALATLLSMLFAQSLTRPLYAMRNTLGLVSQGMLPEASANHSRDEFGQMGTKVDELVHTLRGNADFAKRIGEGKYDTEFKPASDDDILGMSLITMRNNLIENERQDKERNWIVRGVAEISEILRMHDAIDELGDDVIKFILGKIGAIQGAFYVVNDESKPAMIELRASYAYSRKKYLKAKFKFAEGLVGQAAAEKDTILRTEIPSEYVTVTSGILGDQRPSCILIVPLITNEEVYGVLEFAGFRKFDASQVNFVKELSLILARTIFNIKVNERTRRLLTESQEMSNELKEKQEVLRQNAEEMQATQEELQRSNQKLEEQIEEVNRTQKRMQLLLENASEVITIYEEDESIRYISPSVETILGYGQKEMIGKSDIDKVHPDYRKTFKELFRKMQETPDERVTIQYEYRAKDGSFIWIESAGTNAMSNPAIHGYILNSRDITERRRAEQEQRMRSKMQALSENSPDLITRLEGEAISYINPVIEEYTGKKPNDFLNRKVREAELDEKVLEGWLRVVEQVNALNETVSTEMDFPSEKGTRVMQVNAIPEFDESNKLESVLVVSHDITERKMIELEIQNKNKKITESINYAKRIQTAILPNNRVINRALPDSFILYKPRDVVSGDFPWFVQIKDDIFIAAVDCTGHGVPGALLSLIGYFLLNDIVRSRKITEPGKILDLLDEGVTTTLRQDEDATTKDGMDIALCKINMAAGVVEYAGAHRPMYIMKNGVMDEVKGNKFPIGGGIYKNQTNFTNTRVELQKGDSIYFSSDGFPDQFGGPEGRKFGPKRTREIIERVHKQPMKEAMEVFDAEWEGWRGETKQTDDVLLIGIKF
jgi:PAS domain S-box-containing protein